MSVGSTSRRADVDPAEWSTNTHSHSTTHSTKKWCLFIDHSVHSNRAAEPKFLTWLFNFFNQRDNKHLESGRYGFSLVPVLWGTLRLGWVTPRTPGSITGSRPSREGVAVMNDNVPRFRDPAGEQLTRFSHARTVNMLNLLRHPAGRVAECYYVYSNVDTISSVTLICRAGMRFRSESNKHPHSSGNTETYWEVSSSSRDVEMSNSWPLMDVTSQAVAQTARTERWFIYFFIRKYVW